MFTLPLRKKRMKWASSLSGKSTLEAGVQEGVAEIQERLGTDVPDLVVVFVSGHDPGSIKKLPALMGRLLKPRHIIGCAAGGVVGAGREREARPGLSITAAVLPRVKIKPFYLPAMHPFATINESDNPLDMFGISPAEQPHLLLLADPFSFDTEGCLPRLDQAFPESCKIGGLASGGQVPGSNPLFLESERHNGGLVGLSFSGDVVVDAVVAQGCRPIGMPMFVTRCRGNRIQELDGRIPVEVIQALFGTLPESDQLLFRQALFLGLAMSAESQQHRQGDFLMRNITGVDTHSGAILVGAEIEPHQVVQFHLRDARTSRDDLEAVLSRYGEEPKASDPQGALLFSCLGRGRNLYGKADHDTQMFHARLGPIPLGGFFCNGEIGPVQGRTFIHGYTSSFALFRPKEG